MNQAIAELCSAGRLQVLSYCEGQPLKLVGLLPKMLVVPEETAFPGYGQTVTLPDADHIDTCKPPTRADPAYSELLQLIIRVSQGCREGDDGRHPEGAKACP
jgi:hypothetical protein